MDIHRLRECHICGKVFARKQNADIHLIGIKLMYRALGPSWKKNPYNYTVIYFENVGDIAFPWIGILFFFESGKCGNFHIVSGNFLLHKLNCCHGKLLEGKKLLKARRKLFAEIWHVRSVLKVIWSLEFFIKVCVSFFLRFEIRFRVKE